MRFLAQRKSEKLTRLDEEIKSIKDKLAPSKNSEEYKECSKNLLKTLEKEEKDQRAKKKKKYIWDKQDYQSGFVFVWQKKLASESEGDNGMDTQPQGAALGESVNNPALSQSRGDTHHTPRRDNGPKRVKNKPRGLKNGSAQSQLGTSLGEEEF